ncbi:DUF6356 family protein [Primorskyibacter sp. 2E107]|uniref:DUF6356 family protein n=1 Tax=Primorskyibacter sp. 2E107 TaxID=3403458 RepID=UPI003AF5CEB5
MKADHNSSSPVPGFIRAFVDHPASVNETYLQHAAFAGRFAILLFAAGGAALVHAVVPPLFESTASRMIKQMHADMQARH